MRRLVVILYRNIKLTSPLLVAHRLRTVIDYDRLLVLDEGRVSEKFLLNFYLLILKCTVAMNTLYLSQSRLSNLIHPGILSKKKMDFSDVCV